MAEAQAILEAVLRLRPDLRTQYELHTALLETIAEMQSYFSTIPKDVLGIILSMIPAGPQSHAMIYDKHYLHETHAEDSATAEKYSRIASNQMTEQFNDFRQKFQLRRADSFGPLFATRQNMTAQPEFATVCAKEGPFPGHVEVKRGFDRQICFSRTDMTMLDGTPQMYYQYPNNTIFALKETFHLLGSGSKFIMPCRLILFHNSTRTVVFDPMTGVQILVKKGVFDPPIGRFIVDDFGNLLPINNVISNMFEFSEFSGFSFVLRLY